MEVGLLSRDHILQQNEFGKTRPVSHGNGRISAGILHHSAGATMDDNHLCLALQLIPIAVKSFNSSSFLLSRTGER